MDMVDKNSACPSILGNEFSGKPANGAAAERTSRGSNISSWQRRCRRKTFLVLDRPGIFVSKNPAFLRWLFMLTIQ